MSDTIPMVLLVLEFNPEELRFYAIPDAPAWLKTCHGAMVNSTEIDLVQEKLMLRVLDATQSNPEHRDDPTDPLGGAWVKYLCPIVPMRFDGPVTVIHCGMML